MSDNYETDFAIWADGQALALRDHLAGGNRPVDWKHIIEEIESLGASDRRELRNRLQTIMIHLFKLQYSRDGLPRRGWGETVAEHRDRLDDLLRENHSLRAEVSTYIAQEIYRARKRAAEAFIRFDDTGVIDPDATLTAEQVLTDWYPPEAD
jgi:Domain of unknown function DUF29